MRLNSSSQYWIPRCKTETYSRWHTCIGFFQGADNTFDHVFAHLDDRSPRENTGWSRSLSEVKHYFPAGKTVIGCQKQDESETESEVSWRNGSSRVFFSLIFETWCGKLPHFATCGRWICDFKAAGTHLADQIDQLLRKATASMKVARTQSHYCHACTCGLKEIRGFRGDKVSYSFL